MNARNTRFLQVIAVSLLAASFLPQLGCAKGLGISFSKQQGKTAQLGGLVLRECTSPDFEHDCERMLDSQPGEPLNFDISRKSQYYRFDMTIHAKDKTTCVTGLLLACGRLSTLPSWLRPEIGVQEDGEWWTKNTPMMKYFCVNNVKLQDKTPDYYNAEDSCNMCTNGSALLEVIAPVRIRENACPEK